MSERDKATYWNLKADPVKYAAYLERKRQESHRRQGDTKYDTERKRKWRLANPEKTERMRKANHAVESAVRTGRLVRPRHCSECGQQGEIEGHHHSYAPEHWLDVVWLCEMCHAKQHHGRKS